jgi:microcystin degradation protein MlrC
MRILVAGFHHETNTFASSQATYDNFESGDGWAPMKRGIEVLNLRGINVPMGGFITAMDALGHTLIPVLWAAANPSGRVTEDAYERIAGEITEAAQNNEIDAIYLDLHGAMVVDHVDDGEGELLQRLRQIVGPSVAIIASLDLHANVTQRMLDYSDGLVAYRTYPHVDMAETGMRAAQLLKDVRRYGGSSYRVSRRLPFLIPINGMCTTVAPAKWLYRQLGALEAGDIWSISFAPGFPAADFPECGPTIWGYGQDEYELTQAIDALFDRVVQSEENWGTRFFTPDEAVLEAMRISEHAARPVVIADTQDNPGAGGGSNTTGMLRALIRNGARRAAVGLICDPSVARAAHVAGAGARIRTALGDQSETSFEGEFLVESLSDGKGLFEGPMMTGACVELGLTACLKIEDVRVVVSSERVQMIDRNLYRMVGIQPELMKILVNKSSVHFRADFEPIAEAVIVAKSPGVALVDPADFPWTRLRHGLRTSPMGQALSYTSLTPGPVD